MLNVPANHVAEITFNSARHSAPLDKDVTVDVLFTAPSGETARVPAFWAGGSLWKVRYSSGEVGLHSFRTLCADARDHGLNDVEGSLIVTPYEGPNPLFRHGALRLSQSRRTLQHADGTPFFWLGDTWWMGLCKRIHWPDEFRELVSDRVAKGFNVVQIVAGLYPDMGAFDERGANEGGFPWEPDWSAIRPIYFDWADHRIAHLVDNGIVPCIVGAWGYYLPWLGLDRMKEHWRYLIARWGAYPVVWCIAGEANLPWYLEPGFPFEDRRAVHGWTEVARYVRQTDPFHRLVSIHPTGLGRLSARCAIDDPSLLDFDMLQTGHGDRESLAPTVETVRWSRAQKPTMPVLNSEVNYEGILGRCHADVQRLMFWTCILSGACGHTYGANGIWQLNRENAPYGASPHGGTYGPTPWNQAMHLPGSAQLGWAKKLLERYDWWRFEPHPEWVDYRPGSEARDRWHAPYAAGSSDVRILYAPEPLDLEVRGLGGDAWRAQCYDPATGQEYRLGMVVPHDDGTAQLSNPTAGHAEAIGDWLVVLERS
ncbi:MAG: DUF4038 domain-containing protein [Chthonomonadales bacterium]